jgi:cell division septum initiation protein DivIVA
MAKIRRQRRENEDLRSRVAELEQAVATLITVVTDIERSLRPAPVAAATNEPAAGEDFEGGPGTPDAQDGAAPGAVPPAKKTAPAKKAAPKPAGQ